MDTTRTTHLGESLDRVADVLRCRTPEGITLPHAIAFTMDGSLGRVYRRSQVNRLTGSELFAQVEHAALVSKFKLRLVFEEAYHFGIGRKVTAMRVRPAIFPDGPPDDFSLLANPVAEVESVSAGQAASHELLCIEVEFNAPDCYDPPSIPRTLSAGGCSARFAPILCD